VIVILSAYEARRLAEMRQSPSIARRIAASLWESILSGDLTRDAPFPTVQSIAEKWGVHDHTVAQSKRFLYACGALRKNGNRYYIP
jgi:DNA-binding transcriptional regulator YhcF (GntR family)